MFEDGIIYGDERVFWRMRKQLKRGECFRIGGERIFA